MVDHKISIHPSPVATSPCPFSEAVELSKASSGQDYIPGRPLLPLSPTSIQRFLHTELSTERLVRLYPILKYASRPGNISPLHHQALKGRTIIITERPDLHLVWYYDKIFIKPVPLALLNFSFVSNYVTGSAYEAEAVEFLRTYTSLIVHESDFDIALTAGLIPKDVTWLNWCLYIREISSVPVYTSAQRYHYGELRLSRLNLWCKLGFYGWEYFEIHTQYAAYFLRLLGPYVFVWTGITLILTAMQTALTANGRSIYNNVAHGFATFSISVSAFGMTVFPLMYLLFLIRELVLYIIGVTRA